MKLTLEEANTIMNKNNGNLDLHGTPITALPDNLIVYGYLDLNGTPITALPDNLTVGRYLDLCGTQITTLPDNLIIGGVLDLRGSSITALPNNLIVCDVLDLYGVPITALPDNLTVGRYLDLCETQITALPDNLTIGGGLGLYETPITEEERKKVKELHHGDYVEGRYLYADGVLTHVKKKKKIGEYTLFIGKIPNRNVIFDGEYYTHCSTFKSGKQNLLFKHAKDRGVEQYKGLPLDTELTANEMITMYRVITGACQQGTETFVKSLGKLKEHYTIEETIKITTGQYEAKQFADFFLLK